MRLVLDTAVLVAAVRSDAGASRQLLSAAIERRFVLLASVGLMIEYESVLTRPEHLSASGLSVSEVGSLLDAVAKIAEPVRLAFAWRPQSRDPDDDMVLEAAINGRADAIVTFNLRDFQAGADRFGVRDRLEIPSGRSDGSFRRPVRRRSSPMPPASTAFGSCRASENPAPALRRGIPKRSLKLFLPRDAVRTMKETR